MKKFIIFGLLILSFACGKKQNNSNILSRSEFVKVLVDMHYTDGVLFATKLSERMNKEFVSMYNWVFIKNNVTREEFDNTVLYYTRNPDEYKEVYIKVIRTLEEKNAETKALKEPEIVEVTDYDNLWPLKDYWNLPEDGETNPIAFKIQTEEHGNYVLKSDILVYTDDRSADLRMTIVAKYDNGTEDINSLGTIIKDNKYHTYETFITTDTTKTLTQISGWILDHSIGTESKHIRVQNISLKLNDNKSLQLK